MEVELEVFRGPSEWSAGESKRRQSWSFLNHGFFRIDEERPYQRAGEQNARRDEEWSDPHPPLNQEPEDNGRERGRHTARHIHYARHGPPKFSSNVHGNRPGRSHHPFE